MQLRCKFCRCEIEVEVEEEGEGEDSGWSLEVFGWPVEGR
jgi:hypothetical protein